MQATRTCLFASPLALSLFARGITKGLLVLATSAGIHAMDLTWELPALEMRLLKDMLPDSLMQGASPA